MEGDVVTLQNLIVYEITGEDAQRQARSAATARPASPVRASGSGPSTTARPPAWRRRCRAPRCATGPATRWGMRLDSNDLILIGLLLLAALSIGAAVYLLVNPYLSGERRADKRIQGVTENKANRIAIRAQADAVQNRRRQVAETLQELEQREKAREKVSMRLRLQRAGLDMSPRSFWIVSPQAAVSPSGPASGCRRRTCPSSCPCSAVFVGLFGLPRWIVGRMTKRRQNKFIDEFANAIDVIVRGVKSGLPLNECLGIIARELPQPICRRVHRAGRAAARRRAAAGSLRAHDDAHAAGGGALLRHRHRPSSSRPAATCPKRSATCRACCATASACRPRCARCRRKPRRRPRCSARCRSSS